MPKSPDLSLKGPVKIGVVLDPETNKLLNAEVFKINMLDNDGKRVITKTQIVNAIIRAYYKERGNVLLEELKKQTGLDFNNLKFDENGRAI